MVSLLLLLALAELSWAGSREVSHIDKRSNHADLFYGKPPLQAVEANGLFNPMLRLILDSYGS